MSKMKKVLSILLAVIMVVSVMPMAFAEGTTMAKIGDTEYASVAAAIDAAYNAGIKDVVIDIVGVNTASTSDTIDIYNNYGAVAFDSVTIRQEDSSKPYYVTNLYTGWRTAAGGKFVFDGVNIIVKSQIYMISDVNLINNSIIKCSSGITNFVFYGNMTIEPGSKFESQVDRISATSSMTIDGGKTDGSYNSTADYKTCWLYLESGNTMTMKNGAYAVVSNYEYSEMELSGTLNMQSARLDVLSAIRLSGVLNVDANSVINTKQIIGSGKIVIDPTNMTADSQVIKANMSGFTGAVEVLGGGKYEITNNGIVVKQKKLPNATVTELEQFTLTVEDDYMCWPNGDDTINRPLNMVVNFKANDSLEECLAGDYAKWLCDFNLKFTGIEGGKLTAKDCYLAGYYGEFGWIVIPADELEIVEGETYPVVSAYDATLNYKDICNSVKDFTAAIHVSDEILAANPDFKVELSLKMTNPDNADEYLIIGEPLVYDVEDLKIKLPNATVTELEPFTLTTEDDYMCWPSGDDTVNRPLDMVVNFKANDTLEECLAGRYAKWLCDFNLKFTGLTNGKVIADDCYLAGYYGDFGWIVIPTDGLEIEDGVSYPVVAAYDATLNYKDICNSVKDFTAAIHVSDAILEANPDFKVELSLKMTNPDKESDYIIVGEPLVYDYYDLRPVELPEAEIEDIKPSLKDSDPDLTFALNFAIKDAENFTDEYIEDLFNVYGNHYVDYVLTVSGLNDESVTFNANGGADGYLAGQYDAWSENWVCVPFDDVTLNNGESIYIMEYAAKLMGQSGLRFTLAEIAEIVQNFDCGVYFTPEFLAANPDMKVTLDLKVFTEDENGEVVTTKDIARNEFDVSKVVAIVSGENKQSKYFDSFTAAYNAAQAGDTITLLKDATLTGKLTVTKNVTIDGNGHKIIGNHQYFILETQSDCEFKDVTLDCNNKAKGVKITSGNVVFDNVSILKPKSDTVTVLGNLTLKTYFKGDVYTTLIDSRTGVVNAEPGTVFDLTSWRCNVSPSKCDVTGAVDKNGNPFFAGYSSTTYLMSITSIPSKLTLLRDLVWSKDTTLSSNTEINLNGNDLTIADGKTIYIVRNLTITGEGNVNGVLTLNSNIATLTTNNNSLIANKNVISGGEGYSVVYENGVYSLKLKVAENVDTGVIYDSLIVALNSANAGETVKLLVDVDDSVNAVTQIPVGVIFDLNGNVVTANNVLSFGNVIDTNTETKGGFKIPYDTTLAFTVLQPNNTYLPIYDTEDGVYRFFAFELLTAKPKYTESKDLLQFAFKLTFDSDLAYELIVASSESINFDVDLKVADQTFTYNCSKELLELYASSVVDENSQIANPVITFKAYGLSRFEDGVTIAATPVISSEKTFMTFDGVQKSYTK